MINFSVIRSFIGSAIVSTLGAGTIPLMIGAALIASHSFAYMKGSLHQAAKLQVVTLKDTIVEQQAAINRLNSQMVIARQVREAATRRWEIDSLETEKSKAEVDALKQEIRNRVSLTATSGKRPNCVCRPVGLNAVDAKRLRRIGR